MQIVIDDLLIQYERVGEGPVILLLHGWGDDHRTFEDLIRRLGSRFTVIAVDLPGFGQTSPPPAVWDLSDYARFLRAFLQKLKVEKPYAVIGHSNGGALAIHALAIQAIRADKLVLLASAGIRDRHKLKLLGIKIIAKLGKTGTFFLPESTRQKLRKKLYGVAGSDMFVAPHIQETFKKTVRQDVQANARQLTIPTLIVYGEDDKATPPDFGSVFHNLIEGSALKTLPQAGHFVHHEQAEAVGKLIEEFL